MDKESNGLEYMNQGITESVISFLTQNMDIVALEAARRTILEILPGKKTVNIRPSHDAADITNQIFARCGLLPIDNEKEVRVTLDADSAKVLDTSAIYSGIHLLGGKKVLIPRDVIFELMQKSSTNRKASPFKQNMIHEIIALKSKVGIIGNYPSHTDSNVIDINILNETKKADGTLITADSALASLCQVEGVKVVFFRTTKVANRIEKLHFDGEVLHKIVKCVFTLAFDQHPNMQIRAENEKIKCIIAFDAFWMDKTLDDWNNRRVLVRPPVVNEKHPEKSRGVEKDDFLRELLEILKKGK